MPTDDHSLIQDIVNYTITHPGEGVFGYIRTHPRTNYDATDAKIAVSPGTIHDYASMSMAVEIQQIESYWKKISDAWNSLKLGWGGESADAAQAFNARLQDVQNRLFGTPEMGPDGKPTLTTDKDGNKVTHIVKPGVLTQCRMLGVMAAANYGDAEEQVKAMFQDFVNQLTDGSSEAVPQPPVDVTTGPVTEIY
jgi:hypothetical protein